MSESFGLKRVLGLSDLVGIEIGTTIGAGVFALTGLAASMTGPGVPLAYLLARREFPGKRVVEALIDLPIVFPHTAAGVALLMVWGHDGAFGRTFARIGLTFTDSVAGIVVAMMFVRS